MSIDLTEEEIRQLAGKLSALLAPLCEAYAIKYVLSAVVQKTSDPKLGTHFVVCSHPEDPMWAMVALVRSAVALKPEADAQADRMSATRAPPRPAR